MSWFKNRLRRFADVYFGDEYPYCKHKDVEVLSAHPVTLMPLHGRCRLCGRGVKARLTWDDRNVKL